MRSEAALDAPPNSAARAIPAEFLLEASVIAAVRTARPALGRRAMDQFSAVVGWGPDHFETRWFDALLRSLEAEG